MQTVMCNYKKNSRMLGKLTSIIILLIFIGCKSSPKNGSANTKKTTISNTIINGGKYSLTKKDNQKNLTPKLFSISISKLEIESKHIAILDLYENNTNYIWYANNNVTDEFYRFISDKNFDSVNFEKLDKSIIKAELISLKS
ncbi:hypothetical protein ULVI_12370 [Cochleicola gelatinilyticus]|uniref:Uncharacterized protein n=2 Tax=Cochleicola gelatinilyticus TaxID=1763537 RepID=A0A167GMW8_9FLAO|nr:hypothetical protein ULVI_12370 [Cochleicola gelatinilyticus]